MAEIAYYGVGARVVHQMNARLRDDLKTAPAEIAALKTAQPGGGEDPGLSRSAAADLSDRERALQAFDDALNRSGD